MSITDDAQARERALVSELKQQSDRGAAIVGAAWVEEEMDAAIAEFLKDEKKARQRLFGRNGALSTFSTKIDLCSRVIASDLHIIRDIRNDFAHTILAPGSEVLSFSSPHIRDRCFALRCVAHEHITEPRAAFVRACAVLNADFFVHRILGFQISSNGQITAKVESAG
jgi:hypothetical protein